MKEPRCVGRQARAVVAWTLASLAAAMAILNVFLETCHPEIFDPEFRDRIVLLRQRLREAPHRPVLLVVGSSRTLTDFQPERVTGLVASTGERPLPFNFAHTGAGPLMNLMQLCRVLREGVRPRWLVVEVVPSLLGVSGQSTAAGLAGTCDLPLLGRYVAPWKLLACWLRERLCVCVDHRAACRRYCLPWWSGSEPGWDVEPLAELGGPLDETHAALPPEEVRRRTQVVRRQYYPGLQRLRVASTPDRAMRELLELCRQEGIEVVLMLAPESSEFRGWYAAQSQVELNRYCSELTQQYGVGLIDARTWLPDEDFGDGHHANPRGTARFTARLEKEVLRPLVAGRWADRGDRVAHRTSTSGQ